MDKKFTSSAFAKLPPLPGKKPDDSKEKKKTETKAKSTSQTQQAHTQKVAAHQQRRTAVHKSRSQKNLPFYSRFRPIQAFVFLFIVFVASLIGNAYLVEGSRTYSGSSYTYQDSGLMTDPIRLQGSLSSLELANSLIVGDTAELTWKISKEDLYDYLYSDIHVAAFINGDQLDSCYANVSTGYGIEDVYLTTPLNIESYSADDVELYVEYEESEGLALEEYYLGEETYPDQASMFEAFKTRNPDQFHETSVLNDGRADYTNRVIYLISNSNGRNGPINGTANIRYLKDGKVVFSDMADYRYSDDVLSAQFSYKPNHPIPEYDSVEVVDLNTY